MTEDIELIRKAVDELDRALMELGWLDDRNMKDLMGIQHVESAKYFIRKAEYLLQGKLTEKVNEYREQKEVYNRL